MTSGLGIKFSNFIGFVPVTIVKLVGELDSQTYEQFQINVLQEVETGSRHVLIDMSQLTYISSAGLRALHMIAKTLATKGTQPPQRPERAGIFKSHHLKLLKPLPTVYTALETMGLTMWLEIFSDQDVALASYTPALRNVNETESYGPSVSTNLSEEVKQELRASGASVDRQRLELLSEKRFLIVMGSYPGKRPMYERARELGVKMVVLDGPGHWARDAVSEGLFEQFIEVDLSPTETVAERAFSAIQETGLHFDGVATFEDNAGPLAALLANVMHLPGHPLLSIGFSKNKVFTREVCMEAGIPSPRFFRIKSTDDLEKAAIHVGFPSVLKPISGCSSVATYRVNDVNTLHQRYDQTLAENTGHLKTGSIHSDDESELIWAHGFDMTLEEFLDGEEFDVDVLLSEGAVAYANISRDLPQPYMKEVGCQMPPDFPADLQTELLGFAERVLKALEFTDGAFHVELKYTSNGPRLIEVNARIGGGPIYFLHRQVWGVDLVEQYLLTCLRIPIRPLKAPQPLTNIMVSLLPCPYSGTIIENDFLKPVSIHPNIIRHKSSVKPGQKVVGPDKGVPDWLGEIVVQGASVEAASRTMEQLLAQIEFPIMPDR